MHYYKRNIGDYAKKAARLTMLQHGAYTLLMDSCYDREEFPTLEQAIDWCWASSKEEIEAVEFVLRKFFTLENDVFVQHRIKSELDRYHQNAETNKRIAREREAKRKEKSTVRAQSVDGSKTKLDGAPPNHKPLTTNQEPLTKNQSKDKAKTKRFVQPTYTEVLEYCQSRNNFVDAQRFIDFYESNGWKVGKNKMKCWKAAVRNWEKNSKADQTKQAQKKTPLQRSLSDAEQLQAYYANEQASNGYVGQDEPTIPPQVGGSGRQLDGGRKTQRQLLDMVPSNGEIK